MFAGDIVEHARVIMENKKEKGAICPRHLREAYRHLKRLGAVPGQGASAEASTRRNPKWKDSGWLFPYVGLTCGTWKFKSDK